MRCVKIVKIISSCAMCACVHECTYTTTQSGEEIIGRGREKVHE